MARKTLRRVHRNKALRKTLRNKSLRNKSLRRLRGGVESDPGMIGMRAQMEYSQRYPNRNASGPEYKAFLQNYVKEVNPNMMQYVNSMMSGR